MTRHHDNYLSEVEGQTTPAQARELAAHSPIAGNALRSLADQLEAAQAELARPESSEMTLTQAAMDNYKLDAGRYRWLTEDHPERYTRMRLISITDRLWVMSKGAADAEIDAAIKGETK